MELFWYSPTDIEATEIARYSSQILPYIASYADVVGVEDGNPANGGDPPWWPSIRESMVARPAELPRGQAALPVYHIGNNPMHLPIHELSLHEPGIVVLHDISLVDLAKCIAQHRSDPELLPALMYRQHGDAGRDIARLSERSDAHHERMAAEFPLFLPFVEKSLGVVVHSSHARDVLSEHLRDDLPVIALNLPYPKPPPVCERDFNTDQLKFVFCGHVGPNRRLAEFFEAWGKLRSPERIRLDLFGNVRNSNQLLRIARAHGVDTLINFRGYVDDEALDQALAQAHFALNLRWPTMGETSASQLRYWSAGLPTLVSDVGWYSEIPDEVACKVSTVDEVASLLELLESIVEAPASFAQRGQAGWDYLVEHHGADVYASGLVEFARQSCKTRLAYRMLDVHMVETISQMCNDELAIELFRAPVDLAVDLYG